MFLPRLEVRAMIDIEHMCKMYRQMFLQVHSPHCDVQSLGLTRGDRGRYDRINTYGARYAPNFTVSYRKQYFTIFF